MGNRRSDRRRVKVTPARLLHPGHIRTGIDPHPSLSAIKAARFRAKIIHHPGAVDDARVIDDDTTWPDWIAEMADIHEHEQRRRRHR